ncbi:class I SAM-dependent methyltransferase [Methylobrevis albus]|uniref:Class I SAM-dependent methyltransferase n=1 Tax=Methylobrevis albus TaxID=2793297 RepID=A0A931HZ54_9HYPH|nr:class I SAM-dependent methyltransferase [Methylobrevis albus]MBH0236296.1 class I SAM-dependent methyltransferase [Methylobrevis albus]
MAGQDRTRSRGASARAVQRLREEEVVGAYARWAPVYDHIFGPIMDGSRRAAVAALPAGARKVLEVGVGTGISLPFYPRGVDVVGIDLSPDMLAIARRRIARHGLSTSATVHEMDASAMTFADGAFDAVMAMYVMTVVPDPAAVLSEIRRVVKPGGRVLVLGHFAADSGPKAFFGTLLAPISRRLGWNARVTAGSLAGHPGLRFVGDRPAGLSGFYRLLEFEAEA